MVQHPWPSRGLAIQSEEVDACLRLREYFLFEAYFQSRTKCVPMFPRAPSSALQEPKRQYLSRTGLRVSQAKSSATIDPFQWVFAASHTPAEGQKKTEVDKPDTPSLMSDGQGQLKGL